MLSSGQTIRWNFSHGTEKITWTRQIWRDISSHCYLPKIWGLRRDTAQYKYLGDCAAATPEGGTNKWLRDNPTILSLGQLIEGFLKSSSTCQGDPIPLISCATLANRSFDFCISSVYRHSSSSSQPKSKDVFCVHLLLAGGVKSLLPHS